MNKELKRRILFSSLFMSIYEVLYAKVKCYNCVESFLFDARSIVMENKVNVNKYIPLVGSAGLGSMLGFGIICGLAVTITLWQRGMGLTDSQVGILSGSLTFAIAAGSLLAGTITEKFGLFKPFDYMNVLYAAGALMCVFSLDFYMLFVGLILIGFASGADLPISLTVLSHDAEDENVSARLIAMVQMFWTIGALTCNTLGFVVSKTEGTLGGRIVFSVLALISITAFIWRRFSGKVQRLHEEGKGYRTVDNDEEEQTVSLRQLFSGENGRKYLVFFACITAFYCFWNLLSNTFGQFQAYILVRANATQTFATGMGIVLTIVAMIGVAIFSYVAGSKHRNTFFYAGSFVQAAAMVGIAVMNDSVWMMVAMIACYNVGAPFAGETIYKIWTQESFPMEARAAVQGIINGFSRFLCGLFALITPMLVTADRIGTTMYGFAGVIIASAISGAAMIHFQKKYGVTQK